MIIPYTNNNYFLLYPNIPTNCDKPPTIYSILESIVNYGTNEKKEIKDLAKYARSTIFNFDYPLSENVSRENFECMILNKFLTRRINFDTVTAFRIALDVKLNEIMPIYNKMFDSLENWNIFDDGEKIERDGYDNRIVENQSNSENHVNTNSNTTSDRRMSNTPQNKLENVRDGSYVTNYNYDTNNDESNSSGTTSNNSNTHDDNTYHETIKHTNSNKIEIMKQMQQDIKSIYSLIFDDLDCLFYQLV